MCDPIPLCDDGFMGVWIDWVMSVGLILNIQTYKMLPGCNWVVTFVFLLASGKNRCNLRFGTDAGIVLVLRVGLFAVCACVFFS